MTYSHQAQVRSVLHYTLEVLSRAGAAFEVDGEKIGELCAESTSPSHQ